MHMPMERLQHQVTTHDFPTCTSIHNITAGVDSRAINVQAHATAATAGGMLHSTHISDSEVAVHAMPSLRPVVGGQDKS